jgi:hypothetical protein
MQVFPSASGCVPVGQHFGDIALVVIWMAGQHVSALSGVASLQHSPLKDVDVLDLNPGGHVSIGFGLRTSFAFSKSLLHTLPRGVWMHGSN